MNEEILKQEQKEREKRLKKKKFTPRTKTIDEVLKTTYTIGGNINSTNNPYAVLYLPKCMIGVKVKLKIVDVP